MPDRDPSPSDMQDWHTPKPRNKCQCGGDMPGRCPGPANCPMCQPNEEEEEDEE